MQLALLKQLLNCGISVDISSALQLYPYLIQDQPPSGPTRIPSHSCPVVETKDLSPHERKLNKPLVAAEVSARVEMAMADQGASWNFGGASFPLD